jgi:polysaccharide export outer membrane protein
MHRRIFLAILCGSAGLGGCARPVPRVPDAFAETNDPYLLAAGDRLRVIVYGQDNLSNVYGVDPSGRIAMPLIGPVAVSGSTIRDVEQRIEARLRAGYIREPKVSVDIDVYRPFYVLGEVNTAGQFPYVAGMTVQKAIAIAGGFSARAYRGRVELTRMVRGQSLTGEVPIDYPIKPGDTVVVRERWF